MRAGHRGSDRRRSGGDHTRDSTSADGRRRRRRSTARRRQDHAAAGTSRPLPARARARTAGSSSGASSAAAAPGSSSASGRQWRPARTGSMQNGGDAGAPAGGSAPGGSASGGAPPPAENALAWRHESVTPVHPATGRYLAADGGDPDRRRDRLPVPAAVGAARGRLPDHPGADLPARRQSRGHDLDRDRAARTAIRPDAGPQGDVLAQLGRRLGADAAVRSEPQHRHRGTGSAGGHQRRRQPAAEHAAGAADLRQGQSGGCARS